MEAPVPDDDALWNAESEDEWSREFVALHGPDDSPMPSVNTLYAHFVSHDLETETLPPTSLRLLLHPLQVSICQHRQTLDCLAERGHWDAGHLAQARLTENAGFLEKWLKLCRRSQQAYNDERHRHTTSANLIMYHLISLNAVTSFHAIEKYARGALRLGSYHEGPWLASRAISVGEKALYHCGQVYRHLRAIPENARPAWWPGAVYRASLIAWATSKALGNTSSPPIRAETPAIQRVIQLDHSTEEESLIIRQLKRADVNAVFTDRAENKLSLQDPISALRHGRDLLYGADKTRLVEAINLKLHAFIERAIRSTS
ncbi:MAG: hypothetical protein Q9227_003991 [Pyrenula ochraceoflavens]